MHSKNIVIPSEHIVPLNMNGLHGRMLKLTARGKIKREIVFVYGHHASLERIYGFVDFLSSYGNVIAPDLPGFGGMDSFYKIGEKPTLDSLADYLASIVKLRCRHKKITLVGFSFGFLVVTRMLQRNPGLVDKIELLVSIGGFSNSDEMVYSLPRMKFYRLMTKVLSYKPSAMLFRNTALHPRVIRMFYAKTYNAKSKLAGLSPEELARALDFEVELWRINEPRTHMRTTNDMLNIDNTTAKVNLNLWHVYASNDRYIDHKITIKNLKKTFRHVNTIRIRSANHSPTIMAKKAEVAAYFPTRLKRILAKVQN